MTTQDSQGNKTIGAALITGASRGLGRALALTLGKLGTRVVLVARNAAELQAVVAEVEQGGGTAFAIAADIGDKQAIHRIAGEAAALAGPIDLLINNASSLGPTPLPLLLDTECEDLERVLAVNLVGPFRLTKLIAGSMALRQTGLVIHISSDAGVEAYPRWGAYAVSKAAFDHLTRIFAAELSDSGVRFVVIDPGEMNTKMHADAMPEADPATLADPAAVAARIVALVQGQVPFKSGQRVAASSIELRSEPQGVSS
jgi:NAD(P)-dependent dehydrogenase (short-subunit alcohol dehydrogenase family)